MRTCVLEEADFYYFWITKNSIKSLTKWRWWINNGNIYLTFYMKNPFPQKLLSGFRLDITIKMGYNNVTCSNLMFVDIQVWWWLLWSWLPRTPQCWPFWPSASNVITQSVNRWGPVTSVPKAGPWPSRSSLGSAPAFLPGNIALLILTWIQVTRVSYS